MGFAVPAAQTKLHTPQYLPSQARPLLLTEGTRSPRSMRSLINLLLSDSDDSSFRRSSPVERCVNPYFSTSFSHCVPLPEPGPPTREVTHQTESGACFDRIHREASVSLTKHVWALTMSRGRCWSMRVHGEWDTALALKELPAHGGGRRYRQTSSCYRWPSGRRSGGHAVSGEGRSAPFWRREMQVRGVPRGTKSARVHSMTTGPRKQNPQQRLALHV